MASGELEKPYHFTVGWLVPPPNASQKWEGGSCAHIWEGAAELTRVFRFQMFEVDGLIQGEEVGEREVGRFGGSTFFGKLNFGLSYGVMRVFEGVVFSRGDRPDGHENLRGSFFPSAVWRYGGELCLPKVLSLGFRSF